MGKWRWVENVKKRVDYERIAPDYNRRFADGGLEGVATGLLGLAQELAARRVLEVGCGTGHWLEGLAATVPELYGLDLSAGMLAQAGERQAPLRLSRGRAGWLPFSDRSFDLVYCVNAIHHFEAQRAFVAEARRLLRPGGALAVVGMDPHGRRDSWYVYHYFEGTYETDLDRFPSWGTVLDWMAAASFARIGWRPAEEIVDHKVGRAVLDDPFLRQGACSQLALLDDGAYAAGLARIEAALDAAETAGKALTFRTDLFIAMVVGWI